MQNNSVHVKNDEETRPVPVIDLFELWEFFWNVKKKKKEKESWEQCTSASFSVGRNYSPRDFRLIKLEGNYVIFVALLAGPKNKKKKNSTDRSGRWKEKFTQCWIQMCDYFKITRLKRIFCVTEPFSYRTFHGYTLFETIEKISFLSD